MIIAMKRIRLHTFSISYCIIGFLLPTLGILLLNNVNYLVISGSAFIFAITLIHIHMSRQEHISDLILEPEKILIIYRKFNKISKEIPISINDIKRVEINITKQLSNSNISNTFPFQINVNFYGDSLYRNFRVKKGNYNVAFQIYNMLLNIVNDISIKASGVHSEVIQADIDNYIRLGKRLSFLSRFMQTQSKHNLIEISVGIIILLLFLIFILFMFINYVFK